MHSRANSSEDRRERAVAAALRRTELNRPVDEVALLVLLAEQGTIPLDQLARFLDRSLEATVHALQKLEREGDVEQRDPSPTPPRTAQAPRCADTSPHKPVSHLGWLQNLPPGSHPVVLFVVPF